MPVRLTIEIDDEVADAMDKMVADMNLDFPRELAAAAALRDWLIAVGYLQNDDLEEDTPPEGEA
ncbi:hypothetical protein [Mesorhizobium sp. 1B3]|uniref:hypothetical protein n=1 Tax=Mesorhizobium sp. 1B3 TaxID=3243599 RepID=UPI003D98C7F0